MIDYGEFLQQKGLVDQPSGLTDIQPLSPMLFPFQADIVRWALRRGRAALFSDCGMGKTVCELEWARQIPGRVLIAAPLAVAGQTVREAEKFNIDGVKYLRADDGTTPITVTNYEMLKCFNPNKFKGVVLDECFPKDTNIDVIGDAGEVTTRPIQNIQTGDKIVNAFGVDTVARTYRREVKYAVRIKTRSGKVVTSSPLHPYFTKRGWVRAVDLQAGNSQGNAVGAGMCSLPRSFQRR